MWRNKLYTYEEYQTYIRTSPTWQDNRQACFQRAGYTCQWCGIKGVELHCHHTPEAYAVPLGQERVEDLRCWCADCHGWYHKTRDKFHPKGSRIPPEHQNREAISLSELDQILEDFSKKF